MATSVAAQPSLNGTRPDQIEKEPQLAHTATNISISPELFEKLYLAPKVPHATNTRFANATPLGVLGYVYTTNIAISF